MPTDKIRLHNIIALLPFVFIKYPQYLLPDSRDTEEFVNNILSIFAKDTDWDIRSQVAECERTSPDILDVLAKDKDISVRNCVALNKNTRIKTLEVLTHDEDDLTRRSAIFMINELNPK